MDRQDRPQADRALLTHALCSAIKLPNVHGFHYHFVDWRNGERVVASVNFPPLTPPCF